MTSPNVVPIIALITDFGLRDPYVGIMKGVITAIAPQSKLIDISHDIPPGDIHRGAITLWQIKDFFPAGTIFLSVIDPGVGTPRRGIILFSGNQIFVGPDNGLFSYVTAHQFEAWELKNPRFQLPNPGKTFHGRDIFAPCAAYYASGIPGSQFGPAVPDIVQLDLPLLINTDQIQGEILFSDHFGNLITSLGRWTLDEQGIYRFYPWLDRGSYHSPEIITSIREAKLELPEGSSLNWVETFADIPPEECAVLVGSSGLLEIAANNAPATTRLNLSPGDPVTLFL